MAVATAPQSSTIAPLLNSRGYSSVPPIAAAVLAQKLRESGHCFYLPSVVELSAVSAPPAKNGSAGSVQGDRRQLRGSWPAATDFYAKHSSFPESASKDGFARSIVSPVKRFFFHIHENKLPAWAFDYLDQAFRELNWGVQREGNFRWKILVLSFNLLVNTAALEGRRGLLLVPDGHYQMRIEGLRFGESSRDIEVCPALPLESCLLPEPAYLRADGPQALHNVRLPAASGASYSLQLQAPIGPDCAVLRYFWGGRLDPASVHAASIDHRLAGVILREDPVLA